MDEVELSFKFEKATKNTFKFEEDTDGPKIVGSLYVQQWWLKGCKKLRVVIEKDE